MIKEKYLCVECYHELSNPICIDCLKKEVNAWLEEENIDKEKKREILSKLKILMNRYENLEGRTNCIICKKENRTICTFCFTRLTFLLLLKFSVAKKVLENFLSTFSYCREENFEKEISI